MNKTQSAVRWILVVLMVAMPTVAAAESAIDMLSGFDAERIDACYPGDDDKTTGELAKLLYRLGKADAQTLTQKAETSPAAKIGDAVLVDGQVQSVRDRKVPPPLVEFLEFTQFQELTVLPSDSDGGEYRVVALSLPGELNTGDRVSGIGVILELNESDPATASVIAAGQLKWFPSRPSSPGWQLLSQHRVDVSALAKVSTRNREPLLAEDADAFYPMLNAANEIGADVSIQPQQAIPLDLLREPEKFSGDWLTIRLNTVRVTRVSVSEPLRQQQLGSDHYYQIDAMGDLGNVVVQIERTDGEPVRFEDSYPVSLAVAELPDFLSERIRDQEGGDAVVSMVSVPIQVNGFFFRLWSYSSDFMERQGGGDQFGPLMIVANMADRSSNTAGGAGVEIIGYVAAAAVILGIFFTVIWSRRTARSDDDERKKRQEREAKSLQLPTDLTAGD